MEAMDDAELRNLLENGSKPEYRAIMRNLPMPDKVRVIVELQKIAVPILRARGRDVLCLAARRRKRRIPCRQPRPAQ
jgi:hypothetical protein